MMSPRALAKGSLLSAWSREMPPPARRVAVAGRAQARSPAAKVRNTRCLVVSARTGSSSVRCRFCIGMFAVGLQEPV